MVAKIKQNQLMFEEGEKPLRIKSALRDLSRRMEQYGYKIENFRGEACLYKRYPECEVVGIGMNSDQSMAEQRMFCIWTRKEFYRISGRIYCKTVDDILYAGKAIDEALSGAGHFPFTLLADKEMDDVHIVNIRGEWKEGVLKYSFSKGWYAVSKEEMNKDEY